jgi:hypothetical protein
LLISEQVKKKKENKFDCYLHIMELDSFSVIKKMSFSSTVLSMNTNLGFQLPSLEIMQQDTKMKDFAILGHCNSSYTDVKLGYKKVGGKSKTSVDSRS